MNVLLACFSWITVGTTDAFTHVTTGWSEDAWGHNGGLCCTICYWFLLTHTSKTLGVTRCRWFLFSGKKTYPHVNTSARSVT